MFVLLLLAFVTAVLIELHLDIAQPIRFTVVL